jgi:hypothetical protein
MNPPGISEFTPEFFDNSSNAWMQNKIKCGTAYTYRCEYIHSNKKNCKKPSINNNLCKQHFILYLSKKPFK